MTLDTIFIVVTYEFVKFEIQPVEVPRLLWGNYQSFKRNVWNMPEMNNCFYHNM